MTDHAELESRLAERLRAQARAAELTTPEEALARWKEQDADVLRLEGRVRRPHRFVAIAAAAAVVLFGAVLAIVAVNERNHEDPKQRIRPAVQPEPSVTSSPFEVTNPPDGWSLYRAEIGTTGSWSSNVSLQIEGYTLLSPDGKPGSDMLAVSYLEGGEGALVTTRDPQARPFDIHAGDPEEGSISQGSDWSDIVLQRRGRLWVRVSSTSRRSEAEMLRLARSVPLPRGEVTFDGGAVVDPPVLEGGFAGMKRVARVSRDALAALMPDQALSGALGPYGARVQVWRSASGNSVEIRTVPGRMADVGTIGTHPWLEPRRLRTLSIGGREAVEVGCKDAMCRTIATSLANGDVLAVSASGDDPKAVAVDVLESFATSVQPASQDRWDVLRSAAFGAELHPDPTASEVARGGTGYDAWLLQTPPTGAFADPPQNRNMRGERPIEEPVEVGLSSCLKFADATRSCTSAFLVLDGSRPDSVTGTFARQPRPDGSVSEPWSLVVVRGYPSTGTAVRVVASAVPDAKPSPRAAVDLVEPLRPTPSGDALFAMVPADLGIVMCHPPDGVAPPNGISVSRVTLVDTAGNEIACLDDLEG